MVLTLPILVVLAIPVTGMAFRIRGMLDNLDISLTMDRDSLVLFNLVNPVVSVMYRLAIRLHSLVRVTHRTTVGCTEALTITHALLGAGIVIRFGN